MTAILTDTKNNLIKQMQFYFKIDNVELVFTDDAVKEIAQQALAMKSGARGLKSILENLLKPYMFNIEAIKAEYNRIEITQDTVLSGTLANYQKN
jgi:ATP-dependent Clp protease ATP-binding subunit ClpX